MNMSHQRLIFLSGDLIFAGRVRAACQSAGLEFLFAAALPDPGPQVDKDQEVSTRYVILDLSTRSGILNELPAASRRAYPDAQVIAYAPHVHKERLTAARAAGFDVVMTRGQFDGWIAKLGSRFEI